VIELATLEIHGTGSVLVARRKLARLAEELGLSSMRATHVATGLSELGRRLHGRHLTVGLVEPASIVVSCPDPAGLLAQESIWTRFFTRAETDGGVLRLSVDLPRGSRIPAGVTALDRLRAIVAERSAEELMLEIRAKNAQLEQHRRELEATVEQRTMRLKRMTLAAEHANRAKSAFLSAMSHELRTPLNGVLGYAQILQRDPTVTDSQREALEAIANCGQHLLALINDVLDLSKIESGRLELAQEPCILREVVQGAADIVRPRAADKGLELVVEVDPQLPQAFLSDTAKLRQVLVNLLGNAVKFTREGRVDLSARRADRELELVVSDTGDGIDPAQLETIFEPFKQAQAGKVHGGTGLGLAITKRIVEALGGRVEVESRLARGTKFTIVLPMKVVAAPPPGSVVLRPAADYAAFRVDPALGVEVLVVDDRPENRDVLVQLLEPAGFRTAVATDGLEALGLLRAGRQPAVLMDVRMPRMGGIEATAQIRADPDLAKTLVVAVTADALEGERERVLEAGFDDYVSKPIRAEEVFAALAKGLKLTDHSTSTAPKTAERALPAALAATLVESSAQDPTPDAGADASGEAGADLDASVLGRLRELADLGDVASLLTLADELPSTPAARLKALLGSFDLEGVQALVDELAGA
jgi:signal transduction histidine kinase/DNA-binding NarL/FixJ family response regulator